MSTKDEPVFPQTVAKDENFNRVGGLTKLELFAALLLASGHFGWGSDYCISAAEDLCKALDARKA